MAKFEYLNPYVVVWELHERNEVANDPNPVLTSKGASKSSQNVLLQKVSSLPFSLSSTNLAGIGSTSTPPPRVSVDQQRQESLDSPKTAMSKSISILDIQDYDEEDEDYISKTDSSLDISGYPVWTKQTLEIIEKTAIHFDLRNFKYKNQQVNNNVFLKNVQKVYCVTTTDKVSLTATTTTILDLFGVCSIQSSTM
jgi:hypothetical protein